MMTLNAFIDTLNVTHLNAQTVNETGGDQFYTFAEHAYGLLGSGIFTSVCYVLMMVLLVILFYKKEKALDYCDRFLTPAFIVVWLLGFVVYDLGMYPDHSQSATGAFWALMGVAPMAIIHAFEMFILQSDVSAIHDGCHNSAWFMFFFSLAHFLAAFISMVFVIKHFGFNIVSSIIRFWKTRWWISDKSDLYVFWGMNDATYYLAQDIINKKKNNDARILIIRVRGQGDQTSKPIGMDRLFSFLSLSNEKLEDLQELQKQGCLTNSTFGSLTSLEVKPNVKPDIIRHELRLNSLITLINKTQRAVHMFFLEDDEEFNIQAIANLKRDKWLNAAVEKGRKLNLYCHSRYNSIHRVIEDEPSHSNIEVKVVDSSHISVELLKQAENVRLQPVSYVDIDENARVTSAFNALVVGFSEVGLDTVRFLYEFGAFVKAEGGNKDHAVRSDFHCYVVDKEMEAHAGLFVANAPDINPTLNPKAVVNPPVDVDLQEKLDDAEACKSLVSLHEMDCQSVDFYRKLEKVWLRKLNYVVLATGDDELNMSHAVRIFRLAVRYRDNLDKFRIMVRVRRDEKGHLAKIAEHYNRLWAAEMSSIGNHLHQNVVDTTEIIDGPITLFGAAEDIYTYDHIVNESLKQRAKAFKNKYDQSVIVIQRQSGKTPDPVQTWDEEQNDIMQLTGDNVGYSPTFSGMMRLRRTQNQNIANSNHSATKVELARRALGDQFEDIRLHGLTRKDGETTYSWQDNANLPLDHIQMVLTVIAQTEHLRWNASHQILGYRLHSGGTGSKDEARLLHGCLKDWDGLEPNVRSYDFNVVDMALNVRGFQ